MNIVVFDTETTNLEKPFCYNIGYLIYSEEEGAVVLRREYVVEQVWHNDMLYTTAYYANKRDLYVKRMKSRQIIMDKFGYICQQMIRDFKAYEVQYVYAYNSPFDKKVFSFNCDWFKCNNPFDNIEILDIRGCVHEFIARSKDFQAFCEENERFTENGNYSTTAETLFQYISNERDFEEEHTALADSTIELHILLYCKRLGAELGKVYKTYQSITRHQIKSLTIDDKGKKLVFEYQYRKNYKDNAGQVNKIILKQQERAEAHKNLRHPKKIFEKKDKNAWQISIKVL